MMNSVIMLVNEFSPLPVGGAERQAERLSANLANRGWVVRVITRHAPGIPSYESRSGFTIIRLASWGKGKLKSITFFLDILIQLWRLRNQYSILHAHLAFGPAFAAVLVARLLKKRVVVKFGNSGEFGDISVSNKTWRGRLRLAVLRQWADVVIVLDTSMQAEAVSNGFSASKVRRIVNGIDAKNFSPKTTRLLAQTNLDLAGKTVVLSVGRLSAQKSLPFLIKMFCEALRNAPTLHLILLGDGPDREQLEDLVNALNLNQSVTFAGNQKDVRPYLEAADIFVLPSISEGISNALLEAMSAGLACLATPVGGNSDVLDHGDCGLLLPVNDVQAWSDALVKVAQSPDVREKLGKAALQKVRNVYDFEVVGAQFENLYIELLRKGNVNEKTEIEARFLDGKNE